jgi:Zn-dependent protease
VSKHLRTYPPAVCDRPTSVQVLVRVPTHDVRIQWSRFRPALSSPMAQDGTVRQSIRLGTFGGVPVGVHWSVAVIFGLVAWELADGVFPGTYAGTSAEYWVAGLAAAVLFFLSLLAHEVSHAVVARRHDVAVRSITLWLFGGVAQLGSEALSPGEDFRIAAAGPAVSFALVAVFAAVEAVMNGAGAHGLWLAVPTWLWRINLLLGVFNLIPAAPLDGGRILRSALWFKSRNRTGATVLAARVGRVFSAGLIAVCVALFLRYGDASWLWPAGVGWFLYAAARAEEAAALVRKGLEGVSVADVMSAHPPAISSSTSVAELVHHHLPWYRVDAVAVVGPTGWLEGILPLDRVRQTPPLAHADTPVSALEIPIASVPVTRPDERLQDLLQRVSPNGGLPAVVLDSSNRLAGIVSDGDVQRTVQGAEVRHS